MELKNFKQMINGVRNLREWNKINFKTLFNQIIVRKEDTFQLVCASKRQHCAEYHDHSEL